MLPFQPPIPPNGPFDPKLITAVLGQPTTRRLAPWIYSRVKGDGSQVPDHLMMELRQTYLNNLRTNIFLQKELDNLLTALASDDIPVIPLKGPLLAKRLYGDLGLRPMADLDFLVRPEDFERVQELVISSGYRPISKFSDTYAHQFSRSMPKPPNLQVEIHRSLMGYPLGQEYLPFGLLSAQNLTAAVWQKARIRRESDFEYWEMTQEDELLYLCLHLAKHLISERTNDDPDLNSHSLMLALDIYLALQKWGNVLASGDFATRVAQFHLSNPTALALAFTKEWFGLPSDHSVELSKLPRWKQAYYFKNNKDSKNPSILQNELPSHLNVFMNSILMSDNWTDRIFILQLSLRTLWQIGKRFLSSFTG